MRVRLASSALAVVVPTGVGCVLWANQDGEEVRGTWREGVEWAEGDVLTILSTVVLAGDRGRDGMGQ